MRLFAWLILVFLFVASSTKSALTQDSKSVFSSANSDFQNGDYEQAALKYESLLEKGLLSPDLFYNLGTTYFRLGQPGKSMLALRRAQILDPTLPEAKQNIEVLRKQLGFLEFSESDFDRFLRVLPRMFGSTLSSVLIWTGLIGVTAGFVLPRVRQYRSSLLSLTAVLILLSIVVWRLDHYRSTKLAPETFSIVVEKEVKALTSPVPGAQPVIALPAGTEVRLVQISGPWRYVDIPGSLRGWVRSEQIEPVWPVPSKL